MRFRILPEAEAASPFPSPDVEQIQANPDYVPRLERYNGPYPMRRLVMKRFPYQVIFAIDEDEIVLIAVAHNRRKPFYWIDRLK